MATLRQVEKSAGIVTIPAGLVSLTEPLTTSLLDVDQAVLFFHQTPGTSAAPGPSNSMCTGGILDANNLFFERNGTIGDISIVWTVIEYTAGVISERDKTLAVIDVPIVVPLVNITDLSQAFITNLGGRDQSGVFNKFISARLIDSGGPAIELVKIGTAPFDAVSWEVMQHDGIMVQRGASTAFAASPATLLALETITSVDITRTFPMASFVNETGANLEIGARGINASLDNSTTLRLERSVGGIELPHIYWELIEADAALFNIQEIPVSLGATLTQDVLIPVPLQAGEDEQSFVTFGTYGRGGRSDFNTNDHPGHIWYVGEVLSTTQIRVTRGQAAAGTNEVTAYLITLGPGFATAQQDLGAEYRVIAPFTQDLSALYCIVEAGQFLDLTAQYEIALPPVLNDFAYFSNDYFGGGYWSDDYWGLIGATLEVSIDLSGTYRVLIGVDDDVPAEFRILTGQPTIDVAAEFRLLIEQSPALGALYRIFTGAEVIDLDALYRVRTEADQQLLALYRILTAQAINLDAAYQIAGVTTVVDDLQALYRLLVASPVIDAQAEYRVLVAGVLQDLAAAYVLADQIQNDLPGEYRLLVPGQVDDLVGAYRVLLVQPLDLGAEYIIAGQIEIDLDGTFALRLAQDLDLDSTYRVISPLTQDVPAGYHVIVTDLFDDIGAEYAIVLSQLIDLPGQYAIDAEFTFDRLAEYVVITPQVADLMAGYRLLISPSLDQSATYRLTLASPNILSARYQLLGEVIPEVVTGTNKALSLSRVLNQALTKSRALGKKLLGGG